MRSHSSRSKQPTPAERMRSIITAGESMTVVTDGHHHEVYNLDGTGWDLSRARADSVRTLLAATATGTPERFSAEGRGDAEPLASNDTAAGRAKNRRVEITLLAPGASS